ncbi:hypothetical protein [Aeromonas sanarellii]
MSTQEKLAALIASLTARIESMDIQWCDRCIIERELEEARILATNRQ